MIPVTKNNYTLINLSDMPETEEELKRQNLLKTQLRWLNNNKRMVRGKAIRLYNSYKKGVLPKRIMDRCCNFKLLEEKCNEYS